MDGLHGRDNLRNHITTAHGDVGSRYRELIGLTRIVSVLLDCGSEFFHRRGGLFQ